MLLGDFVQLLHVVDKSEKFIDELLHTDIRMKSAAVNDPAVDFGAFAVCCLLSAVCCLLSAVCCSC